jgi:hypothetical protein
VGARRGVREGRWQQQQCDIRDSGQQERAMTKQPGLDRRHRDDDGQIRRKNGNTRVDTLRETYSEDFARGYRGDMKLETLLERTSSASLSEYLKK